MNKQKLKEIIEGLIEVVSNVKQSPNYNLFSSLVVSHDVIFEQAIKIYISEGINQSKKENIQEMKKDNSSSEPFATEKQIKLLEDLGMKTIPKDMTKIEAIKLIEMNLANRKEVKR